MPTCAFLTTDDLDAFVTYDAEAVAPLAALGWTVEDVAWRAEADWDAYDAVVVRSPWDYQDAPDHFLEVLGAIDRSSARLENPLPVIRWNLRKTYLRDLERAGVPVVPTRWAEDGLTAGTLAAAFRQWDVAGVVAKPIVSANADGTFRLGAEADGVEALSALADRPSLVQPFVPAVVEEGEYSVFAFGGAVSHAILKTPAAGDFRVQEEHGGVIRGVEPEPALLDLTHRALAAVPHDRPLLYARVDAVRMPDGAWAVMELELIEPSLYFSYSEGSAARFAAVLDALCR
ncbi:ATP-grasp domain-containing protein [Rubrivirga marina]|uniref:Prokaryotic glutathione synthetase ATP-binding domain-containing protein n=1 Tax=Rubrivirga marina TaxID=1196024 RepID=A0A271IX29_9BACT|nr:hypothetical protein [Rubrivirga marina]PAP75670.1 hypothetical protein BSZ37_04080 [Rubrivirga marina]